MENYANSFPGERLGSGDGERRTWLTQQTAFEPLPASVLFALGSVGVGSALGHMLLQGIIINIMTEYMIMNERGTQISR
jgi:hypothetical protein